jgi:hypothetical protein
MPDSVYDIAVAAAKNTTPEKPGPSDTYYKVQVRAWTKFDPTNAELIDIASAVEQGTAFLTAIEVARVAVGTHEIDDPDVREQFENVAAAERVVRHLEDLPDAVRDKLRSALASGQNKRAAG